MNEDVYEEESPNNTIIEMTSVNKLKDSLLRTGLIVPAIPDTDDKVPSWDGEVRLYSSCENFQKGTMLERVPVQVKGTWVKRFSKTRATFQADISDLRNYLNDGGIMFFLVQIKNFDEYKIYYASLLPFDLRRLLDEAGEQQTKSIKLDIFPHKHKDGIIHIFLDFRANKKKQGKLLPGINSIQNLKESKLEVACFDLSIPSAGLKSQEDMFKELFSRPQYIYAKPKNIDVSFAIDKLYLEKIVEHWKNPVKVNGEILYDHIDIVRLKNGEMLYKLGDDITSSIDDNNNFRINFSFQGTLNEQINEIKLISALLQKQSISMGGFRLPIETAVERHNHTLEETLNILSDLLRIDTMLKKLHIKKDLNLGDLTEKEFNKLNYLLCGIIDNKPVPIKLSKKVEVWKTTIGNITVLLALKENQNGSGTIIRDFFALDDLTLAEKGAPPDNSIKISPYVLMTVEAFKKIDNIDLTEIVSSIKKCPYTDLYGERILLLILELLKLFDDINDENILDISIKLLEFIQNNENSQDDLYQINRLQIEKRRRGLTKEEIQYLMSMKNSGILLQYQLAANILLESFQEAQIIYELLNEDEKKIFDTFPIKNLWKNGGHMKL